VGQQRVGGESLADAEDVLEPLQCRHRRRRQGRQDVSGNRSVDRVTKICELPPEAPDEPPPGRLLDEAAPVHGRRPHDDDRVSHPSDPGDVHPLLPVNAHVEERARGREGAEYQQRRVGDRLTLDMLARYCATLGIQPFDESFYGAEGHVVENRNVRGSVRTETLQQARAWHGLE
jgi:hypothetical protein